MTKYTSFINKGNGIYEVRNKIYKMRVGEIRKERMGTWMHWQLFGDTKVGFSNGCLKEISAFITYLYGKNRKK
jgi:hypothetical protein